MCINRSQDKASRDFEPGPSINAMPRRLIKLIRSTSSPRLLLFLINYLAWLEARRGEQRCTQHLVVPEGWFRVKYGRMGKEVRGCCCFWIWRSSPPVKEEEEHNLSSVNANLPTCLYVIVWLVKLSPLPPPPPIASPRRPWNRLFYSLKIAIKPSILSV